MCISMTQIPERVCNCYHLSTACNAFDICGIRQIHTHIHALHVIQRYQLNALFLKCDARDTECLSGELMRRTIFIAIVRGKNIQMNRLLHYFCFSFRCCCCLFVYFIVTQCIVILCVVCSVFHASAYGILFTFSPEHMSTFWNIENCICFDLLSHRTTAHWIITIIIRKKMRIENRI